MVGLVFFCLVQSMFVVPPVTVSPPVSPKGPDFVCCDPPSLTGAGVLPPVGAWVGSLHCDQATLVTKAKKKRVVIMATLVIWGRMVVRGFIN